MHRIRKAQIKDLARIAEIEIFNYRLQFYPVFLDDSFYFDTLQVPERMQYYNTLLDHLYVYDDGVVKAFMQIHAQELVKLFTEPILQSQGIGSKLIEYALNEHGITHLWALEQNRRAVSFYQHHGFEVTDQKKLEEGTSEYLIYMQKKKN